jgi:hypothetical protein
MEVAFSRFCDRQVVLRPRRRNGFGTERAAWRAEFFASVNSLTREERFATYLPRCVHRYGDAAWKDNDDA